MIMPTGAAWADLAFKDGDVGYQLVEDLRLRMLDSGRWRERVSKIEENLCDLGTRAMGDTEVAGTVRRQDDQQLAVIGQELHASRRKKQLSLEQLAEISGVSRSMISKIERCEAVPSTTVLAKLAEALGLTFSQLMSQPLEQEVILIKAARQPVLRDETSGFLRRCISPVLPGRGIDWVLNTLPPRGTTGEFGVHRRGVEEYIYVLNGRLKAVIGTDVVTMEAGDALYFQADANHAFTNVGSDDCNYFLVIDSSKLRY